MDEKGFAIGVLGRLKRIFSRRQYKKREVRQARQDGSLLPSHSTQTLQPVDVVWFKPLSSNYSNELDNHLQQSQGLSPLEKSNFFILFWPVWVSMFTTDLVKQAFKATGISPLNPDVILSRFRHDTPETTASATSGSSAYSAEDWLKACSTLRAEVKNPRSVACAEAGSNHPPPLNSARACPRRDKDKWPTPGYYHGGAVMWSPRAFREARARMAITEQEAHIEELKKAEMRELPAANKLYSEKIAEEKRVAAARAKEDRDRAKAE
ncbi:hypothetical protein EJ07DRAFT_160633 [Lizonia empirigonia]|nr:hypothetical protein EJ07DRAFT_160633 [Lizonia empirigonia]